MASWGGWVTWTLLCIAGHQFVTVSQVTMSVGRFGLPIRYVRHWKWIEDAKGTER